MSGTQYPPQGQQQGYPQGQQQYAPQQPPQYPPQQQSPGIAPQPPHQQQPAPQQPPREPSPEDKAKADKAAAEQREAQAFGSIGAQIILDFNGDGSLGARGGISGSMEENRNARDEYLVRLGLDPIAPSGPPPSAEVLKARQEVEQAKLAAAEKIQAAHAQPGAGAASRVSSLAAGLITEPGDVPEPPPPMRSQGAQSGGATTVSVSKTV